MSPFCFQLGMSWWRIFPSKQRIICSSPAPPPSTHSPPVLWATLVSSLALSCCTQLTRSSQIWSIQTSRGTLCFCHSASRNMILSNTGKMDLVCLLPVTVCFLPWHGIFCNFSDLTFQIIFNGSSYRRWVLVIFFSPQMLKGLILPSIHQQIALNDGAQ